VWSVTPTAPWFWDSGIKEKLTRFWECYIVAFYSFTGSEMIGILGAETDRQREVLPKAVRHISCRIVLYYVLASLMLSLTVSPNDPLLTLPTISDPTTMPRYYPGGFIIMAERASLPRLADFINAIMILAVTSVATIDLYVSVNSFSCQVLIGLESIASSLS
jgi:amino acid permease